MENALAYERAMPKPNLLKPINNLPPCNPPHKNKQQYSSAFDMGKENEPIYANHNRQTLVGRQSACPKF